MEKFVTTAEAAEIIGCVPSRIRQLLRDGLVTGERWGRDWRVDRASVERYAKTERKRGPKPGKKKT